MEKEFKPNAASFKDPSSKVYELHDENGKIIKIIRGLRKDSYDNYLKISNTNFYNSLIKSNMIVKTSLQNSDDPMIKNLKKDGWHGYINHEIIDFISYPYEWSFSKIKDAALLHLFIIKKSYENSWILKDASSFNIQWKNNNPIFIDTPSFEESDKTNYWEGYRQFCSTFLIPLLMKKYLNLDINNLLKSNIGGIEAEKAYNYFQYFNKFKKGVFSHITFPTIANNFFMKKNYKNKSNHLQKKKYVFSLMNSMYSLIKSLNYKKKNSKWYKYDENKPYEQIDNKNKQDFILKHTQNYKEKTMWDVACNNGEFSKLVRDRFKTIISFDYDHEVIEDLYISEKKINSNIIPLVIDFSNLSPSQGWDGELKRLEDRSRPDFVLFLAFIHHARITLNIPLEKIILWLHKLQAKTIIEFVDLSDEKVLFLLNKKKEKYEDYNKDNFLKIILKYFKILDRKIIKNGSREIFLIEPQNLK